MVYTLADLCHDNPIREMKLLTKPFDFSEIRIESASYQEYPSDDYICPNELVLSTAAGCSGDKSRYGKMIRRAGECRAAAVIYTLRDESYDLPASAVDAADAIRLPVFTIPWSYRLSDLHAFVVGQIREKEIKLYKEIQDSLFNLFFDSKPLGEAAERIAQTLDVPAEIEDLKGTVRGRSQRRPDAGAEPQFREEIRINGDLTGYLCLYGNPREDMSTANRDKFEKYILYPLSLWFYRKSIEDLTVMKLRNSFVWDLANRNYNSLDEMIRQGRNLDFDLSRPYTCIRLSISPRNAAGQTPEYSSEEAREAETAQRILLDTGKAEKMRILLADRSMQFVLYAENRETDPAQGISRYIDLAEKRLSEALPNDEFRWGISETLMKTPDFAHLYENAELALRYCLTSGGRQFRFSYEDTREAQIITALLSQEEIRSAAQQTLGKLLDYGTGSRMNLIETLSEYIRCSYNVSRTARSLHIQRQSLLYRLEKIESLTELSLSTHRDLFLLEVYLRIFSHF